MLPLFDSHCHPQYYFESQNESSDSFFTECLAQLDYLIAVGVDLKDIELLNQLTQHHPAALLSFGLHPCHAHEYQKLEDWAPILEENLASDKVVAIGETGLDYYHSQDHRKVQHEAFECQLDMAKRHLRPIVIHTRDAGKDTLSMLMQHREVTGVIHCFTETKDFAKQVLDLGWMISFSGIITFKNAIDLQEVVRYVPIESVLIETDAPYLAPVPMRGQKNHPTYVQYVFEYLALLKGISCENLGHHLKNNFEKLFLHSRQKTYSQRKSLS